MSAVVVHRSDNESVQDERGSTILCAGVHARTILLLKPMFSFEDCVRRRKGENCPQIECLRLNRPYGKACVPSSASNLLVSSLFVQIFQSLFLSHQKNYYESFIRVDPCSLETIVLFLFAHALYRSVTHNPECKRVWPTYSYTLSSIKQRTFHRPRR